MYEVGDFVQGMTKGASSNEADVLDEMYQGEKKRDASSKVCGFLFQDFVALDYLLDESTEFVVLEFVEDVAVKRNDQSLLFIQAKYYPNSSINVKGIVRDFYYQYLRANLLGIGSEFSFQIAYYCKKELKQVSRAEVKQYIPEQSKQPLKIKIDDPVKWLRDNIYNKKKPESNQNGELKERNLNKEEQEKELFGQLSSQEKIDDFHSKLKSKRYVDLLAYQVKLAEKLEENIDLSDATDGMDVDSEQVQKILLGVALQYIQKRYYSSDETVSELSIFRKDFFDYIHKTLVGDVNGKIVGYLVSLVMEKYAAILDNNPDIDQVWQKLLSVCQHKTICWIADLGQTREGQLQLLNTLSSKKLETDLLEKRDIFPAIIACENNIDSFLDYLWKIMIDICLEHPKDKVEEYGNLLDPKSYIDQNEHRYICLRFKNDYASTGVFLPGAISGKELENTRNMWERMKDLRPQKWYMPGSRRGAHNYEIRPSRMNENRSVVDMNLTSVFYIECLECIKVDAEEWNLEENCNDCIFKKDCIKD